MSAARLQIVDSRGRHDVALDRPVVVIGRQASADVRVPSNDVSRVHAEIVRDDDRYLIRDHASRYGTFVNGEQIDERVLQNGDRIRLGRSDAVELIFLTGSGEQTGFIDAGTDVSALRQMAAIMDGLRALGSGRVLDEVLGLVMDSAIEATGADRGFIMLANAAGHLEFRIARGRDHTPLAGTTFATSEKIPREVFSTGESAVIRDLLEDRYKNLHDRTVNIGIRHALCVPLRVTTVSGGDDDDRRRIIGVLYLDGRGRSAISSPATRSSLEAFGTQAALAIDSARLYAESIEKLRIERELRLAAEIQRALFPEPVCETSSVDLAADSHPSRLVGGDFFDYLDRGSAGFGFVVGDVAGKGPSAALLAVAVQSNFVAQAPVSSDPADAIARINAALLRRPIEARFATMFYGTVLPDGRFSYCNAGHEPPLLVRRAETARLDAGGPVLGLFADARYDFGTLTLQPGDLVVVCSDGITEARNPDGEEFGPERLYDVVHHRHDCRAETVLENLINAVKVFAQGVPPDDDQTALVLRYRNAVSSS